MTLTKLLTPLLKLSCTRIVPFPHLTGSHCNRLRQDVQDGGWSGNTRYPSVSLAAAAFEAWVIFSLASTRQCLQSTAHTASLEGPFYIIKHEKNKKQNLPLCIDWHFFLRDAQIIINKQYNNKTVTYACVLSTERKILRSICPYCAYFHMFFPLYYWVLRISSTLTSSFPI